ncbi:MAG: hypothetical protein NWE92_09145 [Candidatus Bathyarchaeota archaeon]|nr:hypothetical protein [Candidatus Bathyarchaeota archaeon]
MSARQGEPAILSTNKYTSLTLGLTLSGTLLSILAYFLLHSTPITALGISIVLLATVSYTITKEQPKIPPQASATLLKTGVENISTLVEELGLKNQAIYLPSSITGNKPKALIPLESTIEFQQKPLPQRLIVKYGPKPNHMGLLITTAGSSISENLKAKPDGSAEDVETAISQVIVNTMDLASAARVIFGNQMVIVEVLKPRFEYDKMWIYQCIGSPIASIVASIAAQVLNRPLSIQKETFGNGKHSIELKVLEKTS